MAVAPPVPEKSLESNPTPISISGGINPRSSGGPRRSGGRGSDKAPMSISSTGSRSLQYLGLIHRLEQLEGEKNQRLEMLEATVGEKNLQITDLLEHVDHNNKQLESLRQKMLVKNKTINRIVESFKVLLGTHDEQIPSYVRLLMEEEEEAVAVEDESVVAVEKEAEPASMEVEP